MVRDLSDPYTIRRRQAKHVRRLMTSTAIQNTAVDRGALRVKSEEGLEVGTAEDPTGSEVVYGILRIIGQLIGEGQITWSGPWTLSGVGNITGDVDISGDLDLTGDLEVLGGGRIKVGNVVLTPGNGGRITIGTGSSQIIIDPSQLKVGPAFKMDPAHSSSGAQQAFGLTGKSTIFGDDQSLQLQLGNVLAGLRLLSNVGPLGTGPGVQLEGHTRLDNVEQLPSGHGYQRLVRSTENGVIYWFAGGTGGPGDGIFEWPFPLDQVTSEFRSPERPGHDGIDFGIGPSNTEGTPIPAAGSGVVETVGSPSGSHGWGNYVLVNHGTDPLYGNAVIQTRYAHMYQAPPVSVGDPVDLGMTLGGIGNTGNSSGNHLHFEVLANGVYVNPRTFMAAHGG